MDYFTDALGGFDPQRDRDAALKLILDALAADHRLDELFELMEPLSKVGGIEGEPGWLLERHGAVESDAAFRASVDDGAYRLMYPVFECSRETLAKYAHSVLAIYRTRHPYRGLN